MGLFDDDEPGAAPTAAVGLLGGGLSAVAQDATVIVQAPAGTTLDTIPVPHDPFGDGELSLQEEQEFAACQAGMDNLHRAFWVAGKSLEAMSRGNLHRNSGTPNFAEYVWKNWEIAESQAYRLMAEWRIGEELVSLGWRPRESQIRELTDIAGAAGPDAAVAVYDAVARDGGGVTAKALRSVVKQLPPLDSQASPARVHQIVGQLLHEQRQGGTPASVKAAPAADSAAGATGQDQNAGAEQPTRSADVKALTDALSELQETAKLLTQAGVRRALTESPEEAGQLVSEIKQVLNRMRTAATVKTTTVS
jgi:hypothetical protein